MIKNKTLFFLDKVKWFGLRKIYWVLKKGLNSIYQTFIDLGLLVPTLHSNLVNRRTSRLLVESYSADSGQNVNFDQFFLGFGIIHYALVRNIRPSRVLCIGSRQGYVPAILAIACKENGVGHVDFVDAGYDENDEGKHWSGVGFWKKVNPDKHFGRIGISKYLSTYVMTTKDFSAKYNRSYDYIYIDGDHSYRGVKLDYTLFWPRLKKNGFMVFHDVYVKHTKNLGNFGVWKLWKEIKINHKLLFPFPKESGLGILQKI